jgi:hypothetical protein
LGIFTQQMGENMKKFVYIVALSSSILMSGCATIVGDKTQLVPISSTPSDASILITDEKGTDVFKGQTPTTVTLQKSDGSYWGKKSYTVKISKEGFQTQTIPITASANGWYIAGNLVFGGLIGWFIVDPMNGAMYTLSPEQVKSTLTASVAHNNSGKDGSISVVLIQDVPLALRSKMKKIN